MQRNIKLVSYRKYDNDLILFEHINSPFIKPNADNSSNNNDTKNNNQKTHLEKLSHLAEKPNLLLTPFLHFLFPA